MDAGLFLLRALLAVVLGVHAAQKWWGWFNGPGLDASAEIFRRLGQVPPRPMVRLAATMELLAGCLLLLGVGTPLGAVIAAATLAAAGAAQVLATGALANAKGGGEYPFVIALIAATIGVIGPGSVSLDAMFGAPWSVGMHGWAVPMVLALPALAATPAGLRTRRNLQRAHSVQGVPSGTR